MKVVIAADHAGYELKQSLITALQEQKVDVTDLGVDTAAVRADYPDVAEKVARAITSGQADRGIAVCGSGVGVSVAANKFAGVYACLCHDTYSAHQGVEHDNMNVICLGAKIIGVELAREVVNAFLQASFLPEERYHRRFDKVRSFEKQSQS
jgi:ribose 5-phosphate isomerase B